MPCSRGSSAGSRRSTRSCASRPTKRWQPRKAADRALARGEPKGPLHGVPLAHKDMYYSAGKPAGCGSKVREGWIAPATVDRGRAARGRRLVPVRRAAHGRVRLRPDRAQSVSRACAQSVGPEAHHRRLVVGLGRGGRRAARASGARLRHRRLDPAAGAFLRRDRLQADQRPREPRQRDAAVVHARHRRAAGADRGGLRA